MNINLNEQQLIVKENIIRFLNHPSNKYYLLQGAAGTGKTTLICEVLKQFKDKKIAFSATTNKAVSVLQLISSLKNKNISYITIHKLLKIKRFITEDGNKDFMIFNNDNDNNYISKYNIIIIDESSMINRYLLNEIENATKYIKIKVIFIGDINQLPPINENKSSLFSKNYLCSKLDIIERSKNDIVKYSNYIINNRDKIKYSDLGNEINFFKNEKDWLKDYDNTSIVLAYTNKRVNYLNKLLRNRLLNTKNEKYVVNDKIIFDSYYFREDKKYYTSEIAIIKEIMKDVHKFEPLPIESLLNLKINMKNKDKLYLKTVKCDDLCPICYDDEINIMKITKCGHMFCDMCIKLWLDKNKTCPLCRSELIDSNTLVIKDNPEISNIINSLISFTQNIFVKVNYLTVEKDKDYGIILIVAPEDEKKYSEIYNFISSNLREFKRIIDKKLDLFNKTILLRIWEFFYYYYIDIFADINYGYSITVHKSQGSTYENVFVDLNNIVKHNNNDTKECVYTAITRASKTLKILKYLK